MFEIVLNFCINSNIWRIESPSRVVKVVAAKFIREKNMRVFTSVRKRKKDHEKKTSDQFVP